MKLQDVVRVIVCDNNIKYSQKDLVETVKILINEADKKTLFRIGKIINDDIGYEKSPV